MAESHQNNETARLSSHDRAALLSKAAQHFRAGKTAQAETLYQQVVSTTPNNIKALIGAALCATTLRRDAKTALDLLDRAAKISPNNSHIHQSRAATLNMMGDFPGAATAARQAIALNPRAAHAYVNLTDSIRVTADDPLFLQADTALQDADTPDEDRSVIHFALGKAYQDCGNWDQAFAHFRAGNDLKPAFDGITRYRAVADRQKSLFSPAFARTLSGAAKTTPRPIFIVGMPRSGTTLLERMLAAHPQVSTAGERPEINHLTTRFMTEAQQTSGPSAEETIRAAMTRNRLSPLARDYVTRLLAEADARCPMIIDKMPTNFWNIGMIAAIFAEAPILHIRRDPLDTCLSNYLANFRTGLDYSNRLDTLGQYFRIYDDLMEHWSRVLPDRILTLRYETLVAEPEHQIRRVLDFCDLPWDAACIRPEETGGVIATASRWQARQKINTASVEKWRRYADHLPPLIDALGGMDWITAYNARTNT